MGIVKIAKNAYVRKTLGKLTEGNLGSTVIGAIALMLLSINIDFDAVLNLMQGTVTPDAVGEAAKVVAGIILGAWAWKVGKDKGEKTTSAGPTAK